MHTYVQSRTGLMLTEENTRIFQERMEFLDDLQFIETFWNHILVLDDPDCCWEWRGGRARTYGSIKYRGVMFPAHAVAFQLGGGILTAEKPITCHTCDNPPCCNPIHLFAGSYKDNAQDMHRKGRGGKGLQTLRAVAQGDDWNPYI